MLADTTGSSDMRNETTMAFYMAGEIDLIFTFILHLALLFYMASHKDLI